MLAYNSPVSQTKTFQFIPAGLVIIRTNSYRIQLHYCGLDPYALIKKALKKIMKIGFPLQFILVGASCFLGTTGFVCEAYASTSVALNVSPNPSEFGQPVTLTATVTPNTATGKVTFYDGPQILGLSTVSGGVATLVSRQLPAGSQSLTVRYDGDVNDPAALSPPFLTSVNTVGGGGFSSGQSFPAGTNPSWIVTADFNGDGKLDTALVAGPSQAVLILLGNGDGTFQAARSYPAGASPSSVAVGDFNGDGKLDLVVVNVFQGNPPPGIAATIDVLLGNGDGSFQAPISYTSLEEPYAVAVGDFNNDGLPDVAVANESYSDISIYLGNGDGTLKTPTLYTTNSNIYGAVGLALGDFNGDGFVDIAVAQTNQINTSAATIQILLGNGTGSFTLGGSFPSGNSPDDVKAADLNKDGKLDLVVADYATGQVGVLLGNGNGTFQPMVQYAAQTSTSSVVISDFNGDGKLDIVATNYESGLVGSLSLFAGNGDGTFRAAQNFNAGPGSNRAVAGDFNGDGTADLAIADLGYYGTNAGGLFVTLGGCATATTSAPLDYDAIGGTIPFTITTTTPSCTWTATSPVSWITLSPTSGTGNGTVTASISQFVPPPVSPADRSATLNIAQDSFAIFQDFTVQQFTDVPPNSYQFDAVNLLKAKAVTLGCNVNIFCPAQSVTRDQMAAFIIRAMYGQNPIIIKPIQYFTDVPPTDPSYTYIEKLYELGVTLGCGVNLYCPNNSVTRDQMAAFVIRARYGTSTNFTYNTVPFFADVPTTDTAFKYVQRMKEDNITSGCSINDYCPANPVVRGDMAIFIMRGLFNQLLPPTEPIITSVSPTTLALGGSATFTVTGLNTTFGAGTAVVNVGGGGTGGPGQPASSITASNVVVDSATQLTVTLTSNPAAPGQPQAVYVQTGAQEAVLPAAILVQ
jgi:hypothetical protein